MTSISKFIEEVYSIRNEEDSEYGSFFDFVNNEIRLNEITKKESILVFHTEEEMIDYVSTLLAEKHFKENDYLQNRGVEFYKNGNFTELFRTYNEHYLRIYSLADIGIKCFCIPLSDQNLIVRYERIPLIERMLIDNFINKCCVSKVALKLSFLSAYEIKSKKKQGFPYNLLSVTCELKHINSIEQMMMFIYAYKRSQLYLNSDLFNSDLLIDKEYVNLSYDAVPKYINIDIFFEGEPIYNNYGDKYPGKTTTFNIRFITMLNIDRSLLLKAHPEDIMDAISKTIESLKDDIYIDNSFIFVPPRLKNIFSFLCSNNIESKFGLIEKIFEKEESIKIGRSIDNSYCDYDEDTGFCFEFNPHGISFSEQVRRYGYIAIKTKKLKQ